MTLTNEELGRLLDESGRRRRQRHADARQTILTDSAYEHIRLACIRGEASLEDEARHLANQRQRAESAETEASSDD